MKGTLLKKKRRIKLNINISGKYKRKQLRQKARNLKEVIAAAEEGINDPRYKPRIKFSTEKGRQFEFLIDSGSAATLITRETHRLLGKPALMSAEGYSFHAANKGDLELDGRFFHELSIGKRTRHINMIVVNNLSTNLLFC